MGNASNNAHAPPQANPPSTNNPRPTGTDNNGPSLRLRANITIATLNINGYTAPASNMTGIEKWSAINRTINDNRIAILALQETHLDHDSLQQVRACFGGRLEIVTSQHPNNPRATAGVAFVLNKTMIKPSEYTLYELLPGRAAALKIKWLENEETLLLNVYAPNDRSEQATFWDSINERRQSLHLRRPDFMLGDFNVTEERVDRAPAHLDDPRATEALRALQHSLNLHDAWRHAFPHDRSFTYRATANGNHIKSRLDRIYTTEAVSNQILEWKTLITAVPTDHSLVMAKYAPKCAPIVGKGRWTWRLHTLNDVLLIAKVEERGIQLMAELQRLQETNTPREISNPQTLWKQFKDDIKKLAKDNKEKTHHKITTRIKKLREELCTLSNHPNLDEDDAARTNEAFTASELAHLERVVARDKKDLTKAILTNHGEKLGGPWSAISKERKPRDLILQLRIPNSTPPKFETCSRRMAKVARDYHEQLQDDGISLPDNHPTYETRVRKTLSEIPPNQRLTEEKKNEFKWKVESEFVKEAISLAKNGSATGMDGCPYELWKKLDRMSDKAREREEENFDLADTLAIVFQDIQEHGIDERSDFALGWMCPIYKKKDKREISNYRPITLLNTDYKLLTKVLAIQLMKNIPSLVHPNQAGFIPNRSIFNHTRLAKTIIDYAEAMEVDGAIVALDQEKAYDKIRHKYLWETMHEFNLPTPFMNTVRALYNNAHTRVAINGELSPPFKVTRGVRQGDPLSCALFDLAIEPLACKLRNDPNIKGINVPGLEEKILVNLFADDTTLYLDKEDRFDHIETILKTWCDVSGAKFNIEKTEIIPIGTATHRTRVITQRKINPNDNAPLDQRIRIAKDGDAVRLLGAWIGNNTNDLTPWETILDLTRKDIERWLRIHPTLYGKRLITQAIVGGRTQYLTKVQGMPPRIEKALQKIIQNFLWESEGTPCIALDTLELPLEEGGLNLLNIKSRNETIEIMWLKTYLNFSPTRPTWAAVTDLLVNATAPPNVSPLARINTYTQSWHPPTRGPRTTYLNDDIMRMINTAKKYKTNLAALRIAPNISAQLPAWFHINTRPRPMTGIPTNCLLKKHKVKTVTDLIHTSARILTNRYNQHVPNQACTCIDCAKDRSNGCRNPHECAREALTRTTEIAPVLNPLVGISQRDNMSLTPTRNTHNLLTDGHPDKTLFDPEIACKTDLAECFRIFTDPNRISRTPVRRQYTPGTNLANQTVTAYTDGACFNNGKANAYCGSGIWVGPNSPFNNAIRVPGPEQSNQVGEIAAVIKAATTMLRSCRA